MGISSHRLLALMQYGINITHSDGHRWIEIDYTCCTDDADRLQKKLKETGLIVYAKVYGSYEEALDRVDNLLVAVGLEKLADLYIDYGKLGEDDE